MYLQTLAKLLPTHTDMPAVRVQILDLALSALDITMLVFVGERLVKDLAAEYLTYQMQRLRPGSYKAIRFAKELLVSHLGGTKAGDITQVSLPI